MNSHGLKYHFIRSYVRKDGKTGLELVHIETKDVVMQFGDDLGGLIRAAKLFEEQPCHLKAG